MRLLIAIFILYLPAFAAPTCVIVQTATWRAGEVVSLSSAGSSGNGTLSYLWQQTAGEPVRWVNDHTGASPQVEPPVFGEYTFQLRVTDNDGSTTCTGTLGAVAMDSNGVVVPDTSTANKAKIHTLLGPIIARGRNPWPYADYQADYSAEQVIDACWNQDAIGGNCGTGESNSHIPRTQQDQWEAGTVTLTVGSNIVTCTDDERGACAMMTKLCGGDASWTGGHYLNVRYPVFGTDPQEYGWKQLQPFSPSTEACVSETEFKIGSNWSNTGYSNGTVQSGIYWSDDKGTNPMWASNSNTTASINYYDAGMFVLQHYYRTGRTKWLTWFRWLEDAWWEHPYRDQGRSTAIGLSVPRTWALTGLTLRYLDGRPDMLPGLRNVWNDFTNPGNFASYPRAIQNCNGSGTCNYGGERENGYRMQFAAECGLVEDDPAGDPSSLRDQCRTAATNGATLWQSVQCKSGYGTCNYLHNNWLASNGSQLPHSFAGTYAGTTVKVITGSTTVELNPGATAGWNSGQFTAATYFWASTDGTISSATDAEAYLNPTFVDSTHLTLPRPYEGTGCPAPDGCLKGWHLSQYVGRGTQPFMAGIIGGAFATGYDATGTTLLKTLALETANWVKDYGYHPDTKGLRQFRYMPGCGEPTPFDNQSSCTYLTSSYASARALSPEIMRLFGKAYRQNTSETAIRDMGDLLYGAMFGRTGYTCASSISSTCLGTYVDNPVGDPTNDKWPGFYFGMGGVLNWPAMRLGVRAPQTRNIGIYFSLADHSLAADGQVVIQDPNGVTVDTEICSSSPCVLTVNDDDMGRHRYRINLRDGSGNVVLPGRWEPMPVR